MGQASSRVLAADVATLRRYGYYAGSRSLAKSGATPAQIAQARLELAGRPIRSDLNSGPGRSRIVADTSSRWQGLARARPRTTGRSPSVAGGRIAQLWRHATRAVDPRIVVALVTCIVAAEVAVAGYLIGETDRVSAVEAAEVERQAFQEAFATARRDAVAKGEKRGSAAGGRAGERAGEKEGARDGARRGAAAVSREQAAIAAALAAAAAEAQATRQGARADEAAEATTPTPAPAPVTPAPAPSPAPAQPSAEPCFDAAGFPC